MRLPSSIRLSPVKVKDGQLMVSVSFAPWALAVFTGFLDLLKDLALTGTLAPDDAMDLAYGFAKMLLDWGA